MEKKDFNYLLICESIIAVSLCLLITVFAICAYKITVGTMEECIMQNIKIDSVDEEYEGQIVLKLHGRYYEYNYKKGV